MNDKMEELLKYVCNDLCQYPRWLDDQDDLDGCCADYRLEEYAAVIKEEAKNGNQEGDL